MAVLKEVIETYSENLSTWLTGDQRSMMLNILRDSFICDGDESDGENQRRKDLLLVTELFIGSFELSDEAQEFYFHSQPKIHHIKRSNLQ